MRRLLLTLSLTALASAAPVESTFSVQGVLRDGAGRLQSKMLSVTLSLHNAETSGSQIAGPYGPTQVMAQNGLFTIRVPEDPSLVAALAAQMNGSVWLAITVEGDVYPRQQATPELYSLLSARALTADALNCSDCVNSGMISSIAASKITGTINAAQLNGKADIAFQETLTDTTCASGSFYTSISGGAVTCATPDSSIQRSFISYSDGSSSAAGACPPGSLMSSAGGGGAVSCLGSIASADDVSCTGCITAAKIQPGALTATPTPVVSIPNLPGVTVPVTLANNLTNPAVACDSCPPGTIAYTGYCNAQPNATLVLVSSGVNPFFPTLSPAPVPSPNPDPQTTPPGRMFCCAATAPGGNGSITARATCLGFAQIALP